MTKQYGFYLDSSRCSGCKTCQVACKDKHDLPVGVTWRRVYEIVGGGWRRDGEAWRADVSAFYLSMACNHCESPICVASCPTGAAHKRDDGIVLIDDRRCMGCRYCEWSCPYGAPQFDETAGVMTKCHFCFDEIDRGRPPACVSACLMRALDFGELSELRRRYGDSPHVHPLPKPSLTEPALVIEFHPSASTADARPAAVVNLEEV